MLDKFTNISKSNKYYAMINVVMSLCCEVVAVIYGFVVPKIILGTFGSELNGLASSISQFLSLITIIEGGIDSVVKAAMYKPLAENDKKKLSSVYNTAENFYKQIALIYILYGICVAVLYPIIFKVNYSWKFTASLVIIIALQTFMQYFFSLTAKTMLNADRKGYIVSIVSIIMRAVSLIATIIVVKVLPSIHVLKGIGVGVYCLQPILYTIYIKKHYDIDKKEPKDKSTISQRWAGLSNNLAYHIHYSTDTVVLTVLGTFMEVSVYSVYFMIVAAINTFVSAASSAIMSSMGNVLAYPDLERQNKAFDAYAFTVGELTTFAFTCGAILITPFVMIYTKEITDISYYHPYLGIVLILAEAVAAFRSPYINVTYGANHFRQVSVYAYAEALINIVLSIVLYCVMGVEGVAVATLIAMVFRMIVHVVYLKKNILFRPVSKALKSSLGAIAVFAVALLLCGFMDFNASNYTQWIIKGVYAAFITAALMAIEVAVFERKTLKLFLGYFIKGK